MDSKKSFCFKYCTVVLLEDGRGGTTACTGFSFEEAAYLLLNVSASASLTSRRGYVLYELGYIDLTPGGPLAASPPYRSSTFRRPQLDISGRDALSERETAGEQTDVFFGNEILTVERSIQS